MKRPSRRYEPGLRMLGFGLSELISDPVRPPALYDAIPRFVAELHEAGELIDADLAVYRELDEMAAGTGVVPNCPAIRVAKRMPACHKDNKQGHRSLRSIQESHTRLTKARVIERHGTIRLGPNGERWDGPATVVLVGNCRRHGGSSREARRQAKRVRKQADERYRQRRDRYAKDRAAKAVLEEITAPTPVPVDKTGPSSTGSALNAEYLAAKAALQARNRPG